MRNESMKCIFDNKSECIAPEMYGECEIEEFGVIKWRCYKYRIDN